MSLTPEKIEQARKMREQVPPLSWEQVAMQIRTSAYALKAELIPGWRDKHIRRMQAVRDAQPKRKRLRRLRKHRSHKLEPGQSHQVDRMEVPREVLFDRDARMRLAPRSLTAAMCGDPLPGCSALDRKGA